MKSFEQKAAELAAKWNIPLSNELLTFGYACWSTGYNEGWKDGADISYNSVNPDRMKRKYAELGLAHDSFRPDEPQDVDCNCPGFCTGIHDDH